VTSLQTAKTPDMTDAAVAVDSRMSQSRDFENDYYTKLRNHSESQFITQAENRIIDCNCVNIIFELKGIPNRPM
jgi:3-oxoacyl-(acyl-carrier-protein) synthase